MAVWGESDIASKATRKSCVGSAACSTGTPCCNASHRQKEPASSLIAPMKIQPGPDGNRAAHQSSRARNRPSGFGEGRKRR